MSQEAFVIYCIDTETTGLDSELNDVVEISMCRFSIINGDVVNREQKTWMLRALNPASISEEALAVNGHNRQDILGLTKFGKENYIDPSLVLPEIELWIMSDGVSSLDRIFAGQNPQFDIDALQALWRKVGSADSFPFAVERGNRIIDTKQLAIFIDICTGRRRKFYNLSSLVKAFGVKKDRAHRAEGDVKMTTDLLISMMKPVKETIQESFKDCYLNEEELS